MDVNNHETFFGYKNHAKVGTKSIITDTYEVRNTSVRGSQPLADFLTKEDEGQYLHADSAYTGEGQEKVIEKHKMKNKVNKKGYPSKPLTDEQKASNEEKSKIRVRVKHVFGFIEQSING